MTPILADLTLRETVNVLAGNLLSLLAEPFELGIPEKDPTPQSPSLLSLPFLLDQGPFLLEITE